MFKLESNFVCYPILWLVFIKDIIKFLSSLKIVILLFRSIGYVISLQFNFAFHFSYIDVFFFFFFILFLYLSVVQICLVLCKIYVLFLKFKWNLHNVYGKITMNGYSQKYGYSQKSFLKTLVYHQSFLLLLILS